MRIMCNMCRLLLTAAAVFVHLGSFHCEKEPNPLQKAGLIGQSLLSLGSKSSSSGAQLSHRRGHRNTRPKRVQVASVHMPISPHYHFPAEEAVLSPTYHSSLTAHHKPLLFTLDSNQYEMPISPIPIPVHLPDLDSDFVRGSADDYLFNRELEYKRGLQPIRPSSFHILSDSSPIELSDANILQLLDIDRPSVKPSSRPFSGSIRTPGAFSQSISLPFFTEAHPPNHPLPLSSPLSFPHALTTFTTHLNHPIHPTQHWSTHHALPSQSTLTRPGHVSHVLHHLHKPQSETSNEHAYELTDTKFTYPIGANRKPNNYLSLDLLPYSIKHEYQNDEPNWTHSRVKTNSDDLRSPLWHYVRKNVPSNPSLVKILAEDSWSGDSVNGELSSLTTSGAIPIRSQSKQSHKRAWNSSDNSFKMEDLLDVDLDANKPKSVR